MSKPKKIKYDINDNGCWTVTSHAPNSEGYCQIQTDGVKYYIHRLMYEREFGAIESGMVIRHKCDNSKCCNPEHLEVGTHEENVQDRVDRNRSAKGINNGRSKLTEDNVRFIKYESDLGSTYLARMFNVDPKVIRDIRQGKTWKHIQNHGGVMELADMRVLEALALVAWEFKSPHRHY